VAHLRGDQVEAGATLLERQLCIRLTRQAGGDERELRPQRGWSATPLAVEDLLRCASWIVVGKSFCIHIV
jgi:hypothetical protein